jgi:hypothetical protein
VLVALAFQPVRRRAQRLADRLVYGKRASPYEILSEFSERLGTTYASEELLPRMARALVDGTGATRADVWVRVGQKLRSEAVCPLAADPAETIPISWIEEGSAATTSMLEPIRHDGELLGALSVRKKLGDPVTPTEDRLVRNLAAQAGLVMRNVALTEELREHIRQLRASRQRLVTAQDEERRKLERNLHDGAQQQIVALSVKLRLLEQLIDRDGEKAKSIAATLQTDWAARSRSFATSPGGSIRRCSPIRGWLPRSIRRPGGRWFRSTSRVTASADTRVRSKPPSTSPASRPSKTSPSTHRHPASLCVSLMATTGSDSKRPTMVWASKSTK